MVVHGGSLTRSQHEKKVSLFCSMRPIFSYFWAKRLWIRSRIPWRKGSSVRPRNVPKIRSKNLEGSP
ncbi:uncharacterized protein J3R85_008737 [Psidium guajava]|nr:uncharacterized protein J3R85_008737 [Psidium guajava]